MAGRGIYGCREHHGERNARGDGHEGPVVAEGALLGSLEVGLHEADVVHKFSAACQLRLDSKFFCANRASLVEVDLARVARAGFRLATAELAEIELHDFVQARSDELKSAFQLLATIPFQLLKYCLKTLEVSNVSIA